MSKLTILSIIIAIGLIAGVIIFGDRGQEIFVDNVKIIDGKQIIEIKASNGYFPKKSLAKAGIPTVIKFDSKGTFDCSSFVRVPSMNINQTLSPSGVTEIDLGTPKAGDLQGMCSMGMYPFEINFQ